MKNLLDLTQAMFIRLQHHNRLSIKVLAQNLSGSPDTEIDHLARKIDRKNVLKRTCADDIITMPIRFTTVHCLHKETITPVRQRLSERMAQNVEWRWAGPEESIVVFAEERARLRPVPSFPGTLGKVEKYC
ncbi:uncharacterized protein K460DRAFT_361954 [Cucurbitaria berberidis CBS 394.84]|uniref:Uncharacterized protein n=1 Tax=Cucurbitaria berberidis CBS 394.84 TaxID=1168544 RepID=A0A9P4GTQ7_9PLEO|nr:uncharacterized protein K460DRAFT_361954 [Cucurbitaria berberidis CBS 394.84]KAF1851185.1 hypothetical protein K460DRAFT_361954 [Cucurbitaria berberidis CBS 394.84]